MDQSELQEILVEDFRDLLKEIVDKHHDVHVRFRVSHQEWIASFVHVHDVSKGGIFYDQEDKEFIYVTDLSEIGQFQLDKPIGKYQAHVPYRLMPIRFAS
jgi:hypothetical protein